MSVDKVEYVDGTTYSPPVLTADRHPRYSTGRGGAGNIRKHDPVQVRVAQDIPEGSSRVPHVKSAGRGGIGNILEMRKREVLIGKTVSFESSESIDSNTSVSSRDSGESKRSTGSLKSVAKWGKHLLLKH